MRVRAALLICVLLVAVILALHRRRLHQERLAVSSVAGCYELKHGRWWPWDNAEPGSFTELPDKLELTELPSPDVLDEGALLARPLSLLMASSSRRPLVFYWRVTADRVEITSTNHMAGVSINLNQRGRHFSGWAQPHTDAAMFVPEFMHVTAERIACERPGKTQ